MYERFIESEECMTVKELKQFIKKARIPNNAIVAIDNKDLTTEATCMEYAPDLTPANYDGQIVKALYITA